MTMRNFGNERKPMKTFRRCVSVFLAVTAAGFLMGADRQETVIEADAKDTTVSVYSTASKPDFCHVRVMFSYMKGSERKTAGHFSNTGISPGKHRQISQISDPIIVDPRIESIESYCDSKPGPKPKWMN